MGRPDFTTPTEPPGQSAARRGSAGYADNLGTVGANTTETALQKNIGETYELEYVSVAAIEYEGAFGVNVIVEAAGPNEQVDLFRSDVQGVRKFDPPIRRDPVSGTDIEITVNNTSSNSENYHAFVGWRVV